MIKNMSNNSLWGKNITESNCNSIKTIATQQLQQELNI